MSQNTGDHNPLNEGFNFKGTETGRYTREPGMPPEPSNVYVPLDEDERPPISSGPNTETLVQKLNRMEAIFLLVQTQRVCGQMVAAITDILCYGPSFDGDVNEFNTSDVLADRLEELKACLELLKGGAIVIPEAQRSVFFFKEELKDTYQKSSTHGLLHLPMVKAEDYPLPGGVVK